MSSLLSPSFFAHFESIEDPRVERTRKYPLLEIMFIAVCALLCGANDFVGMEKFGKAKKAWLQKYLELANGIPAHDTFGRVFQALKPQEFAQCFRSWIAHVQESLAGKHVAIDGKTARASLDSALDKNPLHLVSAWATEQGLVLGQVAVDEKSNEITAIPKLLQMLDLSGAIVTIDAMGCQKEIVKEIRAQEADYVLTVKGNQEHLEEDIIEHFSKVDEQLEAGQKCVSPDVYEKKDKGHGREEYRRCDVLPVPPTLRNRDKWQDLQSIGRVLRGYTEKGEEKVEMRYFISNLPPKAKKMAQVVRSHWGIENGLHWVLDMTFAEDRSRARLGNAQENMGLLRRWALSMLRQNETITGSVEKKRLQAGWNEKLLEKLLGFVL